MSDKLDKALGDIIADDNKARPRRGGRGGGGGGGARRGGTRGARRGGNAEGGGSFRNPLAREEENGDADGGDDGGGNYGPQRNRRFMGGNNRSGPYNDNSSWTHDMYGSGGPRQIQRPSGVGFKVLVTNLEAQVTDADLTEIFAEVGGLQSAKINYDKDQKHLGTADLSFASRQQAEAAVKEFDSAEVDGRPMYLKLTGAPARVIIKEQAPTPAPARNFGGGYGGGYSGRGARGGGGAGGNGGGMRYSRGGGAPRSRGSAGGRGRGRGAGGRGGRGRRQKEDVSAESLDAEMEAYRNKTPASESAPAS